MDANVGISLESGNVTFSSYESVADADPFVQPDPFLKVTWFVPYYWRPSSLVAHYVSAGIFPGGVTVRALEFPEWDLRFVIPDLDVLRLQVESLKRAHKELIRVIYKHLRRVSSGYPVTVGVGLDTWV